MKESNKRIAKNTVYLYVRMIISMLVSLYTTRIVLQVLGVSDYGIYNVVGGFVAMFTLFNSILQSGTRRYITLYLGKDDKKLLKDTFTTSMRIHALISIVILVLAETVGLWFLNVKLTIPADRIVAANYVYQFSILSTILNVMQTPYIASVTAHEKFGIYAYMSIFDVVMKLAVVFFLLYLTGDKLIIYALLLMLVNLSGIVIYRIYCSRKFEECVFSFRKNDELHRAMLKFSGWTTLGHLSAVLNNHGVNLVVNIFFGAVLNAARGLADTITWLIKSFVGNSLIAAQPQLVKYYGARDTAGFNRLIYNVSQYALFLYSIIAIAVFLEIDFVLNIWLDVVPQHTSEFIKAVLIINLISFAGNMIDQGIVAIGRVKEANCFVSPIYLVVLPICYVLYKLGFTPITSYLVQGSGMFLGFLLNLYFLHRYGQFTSVHYFFKVFILNLLWVGISFTLPFFVQSLFPASWMRLVVVSMCSVVSTITIMYCFALPKEVKQKIIDRIKIRK
jgi:O-antigen/teichoic acid export membrane protein